MIPTRILVLLCAVQVVHTVLDSNDIHQNFDVKKSEETINDIKRGDQSVGGVHIFELHAKGGGMGIALKIIIGAIIAISVAYWCLKEKCKSLVAAYRNPPMRRAVTDIEKAIEMCTCAAQHGRAERAERRDVFSSS